MTRPDEIAALAKELRAQNYGNVRDIDAMGPHFALLAKAADMLDHLSAAVRVTPDDDFLTQASKTLGHLQNGLAALAPPEKAGE